MHPAAMASARRPVEPLPLPWHLPHRHNQDLFASALQELRNLRPHLHSAADYYEAAYLRSSQKTSSEVVHSLQDYCAKALVNSVDHLGTIASHLDESLSLLGTEISNLDVRTTCLTARLSACHERGISEGRTHCQHIRSRKPVYRKHYNSTDMISEEQFPSLLQLSPRKLEEIFQANAGSDSSTLKSLSWYLAFESSSSAASKCLQDVKRSTSLEEKNKNFHDQAHFCRSLSSGQASKRNQASNPNVKDFSNSSNSLQALMMLDVVEHKETTFCQIPFLSLFSKTKGSKSKSFDLTKRYRP